MHFNLVLDNSGNNAPEGLKGARETTINIGVAGVTDVYTLINTAYGAAHHPVGANTFNGSEGASYTAPLIEGYNVRDHFFGSYVTFTTARYVTEAGFGPNTRQTAHLDLQDFTLPVEFMTQTLTTIVFKSIGTDPGGIPFVAGITVGN